MLGKANEIKVDAQKLIEAYNRAPVDGSSSTFWKGEGKEAYQDGFGLLNFEGETLAS